MNAPAPQPAEPSPSEPRSLLPRDAALAAVWIAAAARLGLTVVRSREVYAAWDGAGTLAIGADDDLDPDDSLAQLVLHELCHHLVEGPASRHLPDWGLDNRSDRHLPREHACHRLQAALADRFGLRHALAPTTEHRRDYETLPADPLADERDPAVPAAREGLRRADGEPYASVLREALAATARALGAARAPRPRGPERRRRLAPTPRPPPAPSPPRSPAARGTAPG